MLAKKHRLNLSLAKNKQMFKDKTTRRFLGNKLLFYYRLNNSVLKIAVLIPVKLFNKAHQRNYYRRQLYNLIIKMVKEAKGEQKQNFFEQKLDIIVVCKNKDFNETDLKNDLNRFLTKLETNEII